MQEAAAADKKVKNGVLSVKKEEPVVESTEANAHSDADDADDDDEVSMHEILRSRSFAHLLQSSVYSCYPRRASCFDVKRTFWSCFLNSCLYSYYSVVFILFLFCLFCNLPRNV